MIIDENASFTAADHALSQPAANAELLPLLELILAGDWQNAAPRPNHTAPFSVRHVYNIFVFTAGMMKHSSLPVGFFIRHFTCTHLDLLHSPSQSMDSSNWYCCNDAAPGGGP